MEDPGRVDGRTDLGIAIQCCNTGADSTGQMLLYPWTPSKLDDMWKELQYLLLFLGLVLHCYGVGLHDLSDTHLMLHLTREEHTLFFGISPLSLQYLYLAVLASSIAYDKYRPLDLKFAASVFAFTLLVGTLSIVSNVNYRENYDATEQSLSIYAAVVVLLSSAVFVVDFLFKWREDKSTLPLHKSATQSQLSPLEESESRPAFQRSNLRF